MRLLMSVSAAFWPPAIYEQLKAAAPHFPPTTAAWRRARARHRCSAIATGWRRTTRAPVAPAAGARLFAEFDAVLCPPMPVPAFPHDHSTPQHARRLDIDGKPYPYLDRLVWAGSATTPGLPAAAVPIDRGDSRPADRRADHRPLSRGPHRARLRRADRAGVRRLRAAAGLRRVSLAKRAPAWLARCEVCAGSLTRAAVARQAGCGIVHRDPMRKVRAPFPQNEIVVPVWSSTTRERPHQQSCGTSAAKFRANCPRGRLPAFGNVQRPGATEIAEAHSHRVATGLAAKVDDVRHVNAVAANRKRIEPVGEPVSHLKKHALYGQGEIKRLLAHGIEAASFQPCALTG